MIEYIKKNNVENGNEIFHEYISKYKELLKSRNDLRFGVPPSLRTYVEKSDIFRFCLIHDIKLSLMTYFDSEDAKSSSFEGLRILSEQGNKDIVSIGSNKFFPCNGFHGLDSGADWYYCETCVPNYQLKQDIKENFWSKNIVHKYGFQWAPPTPYIPYN